MSGSYTSNVFAYLSFNNPKIRLEFVVLNGNCYILSDNNNILTENRHRYANNHYDDGTTMACIVMVIKELLRSLMKHLFQEESINGSNSLRGDFYARSD
jgi:hypothetical protein